MGTFLGHVAPGAGFLLIGLWHLTNTISTYLASPWDFHTRPWFPANLRGAFRHLELYAILLGSALSIASELFIFPEKHQPWAEDWSIPTEHLNNFEHSSISLFLFIYAAAALWLDAYQIQAPHGLTHLLAALAFAQELFLFHLHSSDHMGLEGHYHWLLQLVVLATLTCTLLEIASPRQVLLPLGSAASLLLQGCWFIHMGFALWFPGLSPKDCPRRQEDGHAIVRCPEGEPRMRAKALANLQFSWYVAGLAVFVLVLYACMLSLHRRHASDYSHLRIRTKDLEADSGMESPKESPLDCQASFDCPRGCERMQEALQAIKLER